MSAVTAPQFGIRKDDQLNKARQDRDLARKEADAARVAVRAAAAQLENERETRKKRVRQSEEAAATMFSAHQPHEAAKIIEGEIRQLISELPVTHEEQDRVWIAKQMLGFTSWRGWKVLDEVDAALKKAFPKELPDELAAKLTDIFTRQAEFFRNLSKKEGVMRPGKTKKEKGNGAHIRRVQNRGIAAIEQQSHAHQHCSGGHSNDGQKKKK